jgi:hypothetical protein
MDLLNRQAGRTIQNVLVTPNGADGLLVRTDSTEGATEGILPAVYVENVLNTDTRRASRAGWPARARPSISRTV